MPRFSPPARMPESHTTGLGHDASVSVEGEGQMGFLVGPSPRQAKHWAKQYRTEIAASSSSVLSTFVAVSIIIGPNGVLAGGRGVKFADLHCSILWTPSRLECKRELLSPYTSPQTSVAGAHGRIGTVSNTSPVASSTPTRLRVSRASGGVSLSRSPCYSTGVPHFRLLSAEP